MEIQWNGLQLMCMCIYFLFICFSLVVPRSKSIGPEKFKMVAKPEIGLFEQVAVDLSAISGLAR